MCLAAPQEIVKIKGNKAWTKSGSCSHWVDLSLLKNTKIGDFIIAHRELAINKISKSNAKKILRMIDLVSEQRK